MISLARSLVVPALLFSLAGCGLKGPLYLPDAQPEEVAPANGTAGAPTPPVLEGSRVRTLPPAPQSQKKDRQKQSQGSDPTTDPSQSSPPPVSPPDPDRPATPPPRQ
jgi:predicted small lipoprotein YifL